MRYLDIAPAIDRIRTVNNRHPSMNTFGDGVEGFAIRPTHAYLRDAAGERLLVRITVLPLSTEEEEVFASSFALIPDGHTKNKPGIVRHTAVGVRRLRSAEPLLKSLPMLFHSNGDSRRIVLVFPDQMDLIIEFGPALDGPDELKAEAAAHYSVSQDDVFVARLGDRDA